jgi:hypothetical protein
LLCDRSVLDNYAYLVRALGRQVDLDPWLRNWCMTYTRLFKVPMWRPPTFDGTRDTDTSFQREIDATIDHLLQEFGVRATRLDPGRSQEWALDVMQELGL